MEENQTKKNKVSFTVALIARNEEKTLPRLIASLAEFKEKGGEIILLDTGSTDNTVCVASDLGCSTISVGEKFIVTLDKETADKINEKFVVGKDAPIVKEGDRMFDYASARNYIATFVKTPWAFTPDCDEILTMLNLDEIEKVISDPEVDQLEYEFVFAHDKEGNPLVQFMHSKFYRTDKLEWRGIIHECLFTK
jgi:glycosyltransferase involved in cell wall biosynthesis